MSKLQVKSKQFLKKNASTILTCIGGIGVIATAVMAVKETPKAIQLIETAENEKGESLTKLETVVVAGPVYIPSIIMGAATIACIFGANSLNKRQQAALMSAYAVLDNSYKEYKNKVTDLYGEETDEKIRGEIAKDKYKDEDIQTEDDGKQLFYDEYSGRYFRATNETVLKAEYEINKILSDDSYASLNEYYDLLGVDQVDYGQYVGWSSAQMFEMYWSAWIHFHHEKVEMEDGMECCIINMTEPSADFEDY